MGDSVQSVASWGLQYVSPCSLQPLGVRQWLQASSQLGTGDAKTSPGLPGGRCGVPKTRGGAGLQRGAATLEQGEASRELLPGSQQSARGQGGGRNAALSAAILRVLEVANARPTPVDPTGSYSGRRRRSAQLEPVHHSNAHQYGLLEP